ncbi:MAG: PEP-CTERM sorting domain-containing protein [Pseudomonadota bacterium]
MLLAENLAYPLFGVNQVTAVPEPASLGLLGAGVLGLSLLRRKRAA